MTQVQQTQLDDDYVVDVVDNDNNHPVLVNTHPFTNSVIKHQKG